MYAVIETGGKQYKVSEGDVIFVEKLGLDENAKVEFNVVAVADDNGIKTGAPYVEGCKVEGTVLRNAKAKKVVVFKYKSKKNEKKKQGHRQPYSKVQIDKINAAHALGGDHDPILTAARQKWLNKVIKEYGYEALTDAEKRYYQGEIPE